MSEHVRIRVEAVAGVVYPEGTGDRPLARSRAVAQPVPGAYVHNVTEANARRLAAGWNLLEELESEEAAAFLRQMADTLLRYADARSEATILLALAEKISAALSENGEEGGR